MSSVFGLKPGKSMLEILNAWGQIREGVGISGWNH